MATQNTEVSIVVLGDSNTGKSSFLFRWETDSFRETSRPHSLEHKAEVTVDGKSATTSVLCIDPDRPLLSSSLAKADIFLLAFSVISPKSLENIKTKWILEVEHFTPKTHCVLLGLKHDWRGVENRERDEIEISVETALQVARDIGAVGYYETSAVTGAGVNETIEFCVGTVLKLNTSGGNQPTFSTNTNGPIKPPPPKLRTKLEEDAPPTNIPAEEVMEKDDEKRATQLSLACANGQLNTVKHLIEVDHCDPTKCLLHAAEHGNVSGANILLSEFCTSPNVADKQGRTPLELANNPDITILLLKHGAKAENVYKSHSKLIGKLSSERPPDNPLPVFFTGDGGVGKTTLLKSLLSSKGLMAIFSKAKPVTGVDKKAIGIVPYEIVTKEFGRMICYDLSGQRELYTSHCAVLENAVQTSPPIILYLANLQASNQKIVQSTVWWMKMVHNQCTKLTGKAHVIVVGSHADMLKEGDDNLQDKESIFAPIIEKFSKLEFVAFTPMDCRYPDSDQMKDVKKQIQKSSAFLCSPETVSLNAHTFYIYLLDTFKDDISVSLKDVLQRIHTDIALTRSKRKRNILSFIPHTLPHLVEICNQLNKKGLIIYLHNETSPEKSFIVCDRSQLLSRVSGTVFAPKNIRQHDSLATSTGVVPLFMLTKQFSEYDINMLIAVMTHLELCFEITDKEVLVQILKTFDESADGSILPDPEGRYFFFPGLIRINTQPRIWEEGYGDSAYHFGWILECSHDKEFFDPRCLQVLILRIVFTFHLVPVARIQEDIPSLQRSCLVWKNGICWISENGITSYLELSDNGKALILKVRCRISNLDCLTIRSKVITIVLKTVGDCCPNIKSVESIIDPQQVIKHPLKSSSELTLCSIFDIALAITANKKDVMSEYLSLPLKHLLKFEPYASLDQDTLQSIHSDKNVKKNEKITNPFISHFSVQVNSLEDFTMYTAALGALSPHMDSTSHDLIQALETWREETEGTYSCLRETLNKYSIFAGRNPLDLSGVAHSKSDPSIFSEPGSTKIGEQELALLKKVLQITLEDQTNKSVVHINELLNKDVTYEELEIVLSSNQNTSHLSKNLKEKLEQRVEEEQLYQEAMAYGTPVSLLFLKVLAIGPGQVGKTTFIRRLTGQMQWDIDTAQQESLPQGSTGQAEMQVVHIEYSKRTVAINLAISQWEVLKESQLEKHISSLILLLKASHFEENECEEALSVVASSSDSEDEQATHNSVQDIERQIFTTKKEERGQIIVVNPQKLQKRHLLLPESTKINKVLDKYEKLLRRCMLDDRTVSLDAVINLADIGGQPAFLEMLPFLTVGPAMYLVFMKIIEGLKTPYPVRFMREGNKTSTEHKECMYTSEEVIFTALSSIACFGNSDEDVEQYVSDKTASKRTISLALLMGTFADALKDSEKDSKLKREEVNKMEQQLKQQLTETDFYKDDLIAFSDSTKRQVLFRIDNKSGGKAEVKWYRKLLETFMERRFKKFSIPTPWLMFSICIKILALHEQKQVVSFDDCVEIGKKLNMSKQMVTVALQFLHKYIGLVMFFPGNKHLKNIVICDPQAVFSSISEIIFNVYDPQKRTISDVKYTEFVEKGQFSLEDINLDTSQGKNLLPIDTLVNLLVHLNIAVPIPSSSMYFLPAVLQTAPADTLALNLATALENPEPLCITFRTGYLRLGFVCALVANLISEGNFELLGTEQEEMIYRNKVIFRFRGIYDIQVISWPKYCEFRVSHCSEIAEEFHSSEACPLIRNTIVKAIDHVIALMRQSSLFKLSKDYQLAFRCPKHSVTSVEGLGHEPMAVIDGENPNDPQKIKCLKCKRVSFLTPSMSVWFGKAMPLAITKQPTAPAEGAHIPCGGDLTLSVSASGVQPLYYQWIKDGKKLESSASYQGCTSPGLHIKGGQGCLKGVYWCQVTDKHESTLCSSETSVTVELEFSAAMTCDDVCDWLKQNNLSDKDILPFRNEQVDGQAFLELSSSTDFEQLLRCTFTFGVRTKLKNIMAAICKRPSIAVTQRRRKLTSIKMFWDLRAHWRNLASELNITIGDCEAIDVKHRGNPDDCFQAILLLWLQARPTRNN